jgi:hypothetical protein
MAEVGQNSGEREGKDDRKIDALCTEYVLASGGFANTSHRRCLPPLLVSKKTSRMGCVGADGVHLVAAGRRLRG